MSSLLRRRSKRLREVQVGSGLPSLVSIMAEINDMKDVLLGRKDAPIDRGIMTLMEVADAYFARTEEIIMLILQAEREGIVLRGTPYYKYRTGELKHFSEICKRAADLGSRRITMDQLEFQKAQRGRESG